MRESLTLRSRVRESGLVRTLKRRFRAIAADPSTAVGVLFGTLGAFFGLVSIWFTLSRTALGPWSIVEALGTLAAIICAALFVTFFLASYFTLISLEPDRYAIVTISGRTPSEILLTVSEHIKKACALFVRTAEKVELDLAQLRAALVSGSNERIQLAARNLERSQTQVKAMILRQQTALRRIEEMKLRTATELNIPTRRICDHVFQYSPLIHADRSRKYLRNLEELALPAINDAWALNKDRMNGLLDQCQLMLADARRRVRLQQELQRARDLHRFISELASLHSTSGSLQTYAAALREVAIGAPKIGPFGPDHLIGRRLRLLFRKQRAHPGFDLHVLLQQLVAQWRSSSNDFDPVVVGLQAAALSWIAKGSSDGPVGSLELEAIEQLPSYLGHHLSTTRRGISSHFGQLLTEFFEGATDGDCYLVSHGYSKTVREVLKRNRELVNHLNIFLLISGQEETFDARVLAYELKEKPNSTFPVTRTGCTGLLPAAPNLAAGNLALLLGMLTGKSRVIILLGADCFDPAGRAMHARGAGWLIRRLRRKLPAGAQMLVVICTEGFRKISEPLTATRFYRDHFDRVDLYRPDEISLIVTEAGVQPSSWKGRVMTAPSQSKPAPTARPKAKPRKKGPGP